ncbi:unnamed protein product, partial [Rotaria sordida]
TSTIVSSYPISTTTTIDNKINNNLIGTSPCLFLYSSFIGLQIFDMPKRLLELCSYHSSCPEFVKECFQHYFLTNYI